jgi:hypothetical protein
MQKTSKGQFARLTLPSKELTALAVSMYLQALPVLAREALVLTLTARSSLVLVNSPSHRPF